MSELTQAERDFIAPIVSKERKLNRLRLRQIDDTGELSWDLLEPYLMCGWAEFGGPRIEIGNPYNCYRLTPLGHEELRRLSE